MPLPHQSTYEGKSSWEAFIKPFQGLAHYCGWDDGEKLFRLTSSLRGDAAQHVYCHMPPEDTVSYASVVQSLEARFMEKRAPSSYVAQLEIRKLQPCEDISSYIASIRQLVIKGYPTADKDTRGTIELRHFLKGLPDQQMALAIGMREPKSVE